MNRRYLKAGILAVLLGVPALIFFVLHLFGKNHFDLPHYFPVVNDSDEVIFSESGDTLFNKIPAFELTDQNGSVFSSEKMKGKITVANFFFTRCGTVCPKMTSELTRVQGVFKDNPLVLLMSMSVDPKHDSASVLKTFAAEYGAIDGKWFFLTGDKRNIYDLVITGFKLPVADASEYDKTITDVDEMFIHSEKVLLLDRDGYVRGIYDGINKEDVDRLIVEISVLENSYETQKKK